MELDEYKKEIKKRFSLEQLIWIAANLDKHGFCLNERTRKDDIVKTLFYMNMLPVNQIKKGRKLLKEYPEWIRILGLEFVLNDSSEEDEYAIYTCSEYFYRSPKTDNYLMLEEWPIDEPDYLEIGDLNVKIEEYDENKILLTIDFFIEPFHAKDYNKYFSFTEARKTIMEMFEEGELEIYGD